VSKPPKTPVKNQLIRRASRELVSTVQLGTNLLANRSSGMSADAVNSVKHMCDNAASALFDMLVEVVDSA
jgi:hypothetical protein